MPVEDDNKFEQVAQRQLQEELAEQFKRQTLWYIDQIMNQVATMGANDAELPQLTKIKEDFLSNKITAQQSRKFASDILERKQTDH